MSYDVQQFPQSPLAITRDVPIPALSPIVAFENINATYPFAVVAQMMPNPSRRVRIKQSDGSWLDV